MRLNPLSNRQRFDSPVALLFLMVGPFDSSSQPLVSLSRCIRISTKVGSRTHLPHLFHLTWLRILFYHLHGGWQVWPPILKMPSMINSLMLENGLPLYSQVKVVFFLCHFFLISNDHNPIVKIQIKVMYIIYLNCWPDIQSCNNL